MNRTARWPEARAYGRQLVAGGKRVSIRFTPERRHSLDFGKLAA